jgi:hypothetical protein
MTFVVPPSPPRAPRTYGLIDEPGVLLHGLRLSPSLRCSLLRGLWSPRSHSRRAIQAGQGRRHGTRRAAAPRITWPHPRKRSSTTSGLRPSRRDRRRGPRRGWSDGGRWGLEANTRSKGRTWPVQRLRFSGQQNVVQHRRARAHLPRRPQPRFLECLRSGHRFVK